MEKIEKFQTILSCAIITFGIIFAAVIFAVLTSKSQNITVTGSASKIVVSDSAQLHFVVQSKAKTKKEVYDIIQKQNPQIIEYLNSKGIKKEDIEIKPINSWENYKMTERGINTNEIATYSANENIIIKSNDVEKIKNISTEIQNLLEKGINLNVFPPEYFYSDLASIKVELLKDAVVDSKQRAKSMLNATGGALGKVQSMKMGVFQITSPDSNMVSDMGVNDTSTIEKKVTAVTNVVFKVR